jgi:TonB family protein
VDDQSSLGTMFDSTRGLTPIPSRIRTAVVLSVAAHLALLALGIVLGRPVPVLATRERPLPVPHRTGPGGGGSPTVTPVSAPKARTQPPARSKPLHPRRVEARVPETPPPAPVATTTETSGPATSEQAAERGEPGAPGGPGGCLGENCPPGGPGGGEILSESVVAALPVLLSGPAVRLPPAAQGIGGTMRVVCVITATGTVSDCDVQEGAPLAEAAVLAALRARTYRPAQMDGRPVAVRHRFTIPLGATH